MRWAPLCVGGCRCFFYLFLISAKENMIPNCVEFSVSVAYNRAFLFVSLSFALVSTQPLSSQFYFCDNLPHGRVTNAHVLVFGCTHLRIIRHRSVSQTDEDEASTANELYIYYIGIYLRRLTLCSTHDSTNPKSSWLWGQRRRRQRWRQQRLMLNRSENRQTRAEITAKNRRR